MLGSDNDGQNDEEPTELVMKKGDDGIVYVWAVVNGDEIFHAAPHITMAKQAISGAIQTWFSQAFRKELDEIHDFGDSEGIFR